jgi:hypothetical protein
MIAPGVLTATGNGIIMALVMVSSKETVMETVLSCQGCGKEIHYGFSHFVDCNPIANGDCDCLGRMMDDANRLHQCEHGPELMRPRDAS